MNDEIKKVDKSANFWVVLLLAYRVALDQGFAALFFWFLATSGRLRNSRCKFLAAARNGHVCFLVSSLSPLNLLADLSTFFISSFICLSTLPHGCVRSVGGGGVRFRVSTCEGHAPMTITLTLTKRVWDGERKASCGTSGRRRRGSALLAFGAENDFISFACLRSGPCSPSAPRARRVSR